MHTPLVAGLVVLVALAGCLDGDPPVPEPEVPPPEPAARGPQVVVAVIDTGINVYHDHFQRNASIPEEVLRAFVDAESGAAPERVSLSRDGSYEERLEADLERWESMERGRLYYFEGTNVLGISFSSGDDLPVLDEGGHGTGTSGSVVDANPDAIVVMVEGARAEGEAWAARQPWIDLVSMSYGPPGSVPGSAAVFGLETHTHTRAMWAAGILPVGAADNSPAPAPNDETAGPPWVVGVGGDHPEDECREVVSGNAPDVTADFTQTLPRFQSVDEYGATSGTSFATPTTAGTLSRVLYEVRDAWGHQGGRDGAVLATSPGGDRLTHRDLRETMNRTAYYFGTDGCTGPGVVNPAAPWVQQGWGHVGPDIVAPSVEHILGVREAPPKPEAARAHQEAVHQYRGTLWSVLP